MSLYSGDRFTMDGREFIVRFEHDADHGAPWEECDGHGIIREGYESEKRAGWRKLAPAGCRDVWKFYDIAESMKIARRDGWDARPYKTGTKGEQAARAVEADFQYLRAWCNDEWKYLFVSVVMLDSDGNETRYTTSLGGVESFADYHEQCARDLAEELVEEWRSDKRAAEKETRERNYWAARDVATV